MLIDFSEVLAVNVFKLGQVFKELLEEVDVGDDKIYMLQVPPENLVYRFAQRLDFGDLTEKVANDTVRLIKRMNYDWITEGRRPSGVCGACIILAARMNNFRRTTREVMFVAKISDSTIQERLNEFKRTKTSQMTVDELRAAPNTQDVGQYPPSFYKPFVKQRAKHEKLKKSRKGKHQSEFTAEELQDLIDNGEDEAEDAEPVARRSKRRRTNTKNVSNPQTSDSSPRTPVDPSILSEENLRPPSHTAATDRSDAEVAQRLLQLSGLAHSESRTNVIVPVQGHALDDDHQALPANTSPASGSAVPQTPLSPQDSGYVTQLTQRGVDRQLQQDVEAELAVIKGRKRDRRLKEQPAIPTTEEILLEREVESMIEQHLQDPRLQSAFTDIQSNADIVKNQLRGDKGKEAFSDYHDQAALLAQQISESHRSAISNPSVGTEDPLQDDEFDDDPEVANVLLNPEEQRLKETIWTHANRDHLRREIERKHRADMKAAQPARRQSGKGGPGSRKRAPPIGMGQTKEFATAEEAAADMMERRGGRELSRKLNYKSLGDMQKGLAGVFTIDETKVAAAIKRNKVNWDDYAGSAGEDGDGAETATNNGRLVDLQNVREADDEDAGFDDGVVEELSNEVDERARQQAEEEHEFADDDDEY